MIVMFGFAGPGMSVDTGFVQPENPDIISQKALPRAFDPYFRTLHEKT
jgi:hypothetical protein